MQVVVEQADGEGKRRKWLDPADQRFKSTGIVYGIKKQVFGRFTFYVKTTALKQSWLCLPKQLHPSKSIEWT